MSARWVMPQLFEPLYEIIAKRIVVTSFGERVTEFCAGGRWASASTASLRPIFFQDAKNIGA